MGNSQVLEYRFYVGKKGAPKGFYFAPMIRRYYFNIGTSAIYDNTNFNIDMNIKSTGLGLQLGAQFDISDNLSLDWYFLGSSVGSNQVEIEITSSDPTIDWEEVRDEIEADSPSWPTGTSTSIEAGDDFFRFTGKTIGVGIRTGLTLGYRF
jgi:opacity protein-like surface antigen